MAFVSSSTGAAQIWIIMAVYQMLTNPTSPAVFLTTLFALSFIFLKAWSQQCLKVKRHPTNSYFSCKPIIILSSLLKLLATEAWRKKVEKK